MSTVSRKRPDLALADILTWADNYHATHGRWPTQRSGIAAPGVTWANVNQALRMGHRGLRGGSSLAAALAERRGVRTARSSWRLTERQILAWADNHHARHGRWPTARSGAVVEAAELTWHIVDQALRLGRHGLPGGSSLSRFLAFERGSAGHARTRAIRRLTLPEILAWADAFRARHGLWPTRRAGPVCDGPNLTSNLTWDMIDQALRKGWHGLEAGTSLARLLRRERQARWRKPLLPPLTVAAIRAWSEAYRLRHGRWPTPDSGAIDEVPGETWGSVSMALLFGLRGLPEGRSLIELLEET